MSATMNTNITTYFPDSPFISRQIRLESGFLMLHPPYQSRSAAAIFV